MFRLFEYLGPRRHQNCNVLAVFTVTLVALSMPSPLGFEDALVLKMQQGVNSVRTLNIDIAAFTAVPAAGAAFRHKLLPSEGKTSISAIPGNNLYFRAINKQIGLSPAA